MDTVSSSSHLVMFSNVILPGGLIGLTLSRYILLMTIALYNLTFKYSVRINEPLYVYIVSLVI